MSGRLERLLVVSIWDEMWSLGEGCGVPDEMHFIDRLTGRGVEVHYLIPEPAGGGFPYRREGLTYHTYPNVLRSAEGLPGPIRRVLSPWRFYRTVLPRIRELITATRPDMVLGYSYYTIPAVGRAAREAGIPSAAKLFGVMYLNHPLPPHRYWWYNYEQVLALRSRLDHYLVLNDGTQGREALERRGIPPERITFLPNGMDMSWASLEVDRAQERERFGLPADRSLMMTFSRLVPSKRVGLFLEAVSRIDPVLLSGAAVVIGGDGPERAALERLAATLGLSGSTIFTGAVRYEDIPRLLKACDLFVGTNELTNMSMPPCEALLCGLPVVAFDVAGTSEAVGHGENGLLVPDGDTGALASAMEVLLKDPALRARMGAAASRRAQDEFMSWDERVSSEIALFDSLVEKGTGGKGGSG